MRTKTAGLAGAVSALCMLALLFASAARAQDSIAEVTALSGSASATSERGVLRDLELGSDLFRGDRLQTALDSAMAIRFTDGTRFELDEDTSMAVDDYNYSEDEPEPSFVSSIFKGAFRFVSGLIAKRRARSMGVRTPVATIGIRGTSVAGEAQATSARIMLLEPEEGEGPTAIEVSNQYGSVTIDEPGFGTEVPDANSPPSPPRRMSLRVIENLQRSLRNIGRVRPPTPRIRR